MHSGKVLKCLLVISILFFDWDLVNKYYKNKLKLQMILVSYAVLISEIKASELSNRIGLS